MSASSPADGPAGDADSPDSTWQAITGIDIEGATFPARAKLGSEWIVVFRTAAGLRGTQRACPHQQASMLDAVAMSGGTMLRCPRHNFIFRITDGRGVNCPGFALVVYEIREDSGVLYGRRAR